MNIELYSIRGFTGSALKQKLEEALTAHQVPCTLVEIHQVDQFIKAGLASVPAFKIGNKVIQHPHDGDVDETVAKVMDFLRGQNAKSILVPLDFSEESKHAVEYARMMARHLGYGLTLAHIHQTLYDPISAGALDIQFLQDTNKRLMDMVDTLNSEHSAHGIHVPVNAHLEVGEASSSLIELLDHGQYEVMVMATKATDNAFRRFFGSVSSEVSRRSHKPVIVVPPQAEVSFPGRMIVGFTEELLLEGVLENILAFATNQHIVFDFVHVTDDAPHYESIRQQLSEKLAVNRPFVFDFNIKSLQDEEMKIHEVLFRYATQMRAGMVILVSHHRSFLDNMTHTSVTRKALLLPSVPLMIVHSTTGGDKQ
jgi:nucleotide-binding universal stress UspA family protein